MNKKGFTLTEMMIVLMIISGLMYLLIPNIASSKDTVETKTCTVYMNLVNSQIQAYILDVGTPPADLDTLVQLNYITSTTCPSGEQLILIDDHVDFLSVVTP